MTPKKAGDARGPRRARRRYRRDGNRYRGQAAEKPKPAPRTFPAGTYVVRMDQPYSRIADTLLDYQYWAPNDPQKSIYDDTGWTFGELFGNVQVARVTDVKVLDATIDSRGRAGRAPGGVEGTGGIFLINHNADSALDDAALPLPRRRLRGRRRAVRGGRPRSSTAARSSSATSRSDDAGQGAAPNSGVRAYAVAAAPSVKTHPVQAARIALMHTWLSTQDEGWWRLEFDRLKIPYDYISTQTVSKDAGPAVASTTSSSSRRAFAGIAQTIVGGMPMYGNPLPWKTTALTPNLGKID